MDPDCVTNTGSVGESVTRWVAGARFCVWSCAQDEVVVSNIPSAVPCLSAAMGRSMNCKGMGGGRGDAHSKTATILA